MHERQVEECSVCLEGAWRWGCSWSPGSWRSAAAPILPLITTQLQVITSFMCKDPYSFNLQSGKAWDFVSQTNRNLSTDTSGFEALIVTWPLSPCKMVKDHQIHACLCLYNENSETLLIKTIHRVRNSHPACATIPDWTFIWVDLKHKVFEKF